MDRLVLPPVQTQLDLRAIRVGADIEACEGCVPQISFDVESFAPVSGDDDVDGLREVQPGPGLSEKIHVGRPAVQEAVSLDCIPARQSEAEGPGASSATRASRS